MTTLQQRQVSAIASHTPYQDKNGPFPLARPLLGFSIAAVSNLLPLGFCNMLLSRTLLPLSLECFLSFFLATMTGTDDLVTR